MMVSTRTWRSTLFIFIASIALPVLIAVLIASRQPEKFLWIDFDDRWSINSGTIDHDRWQVQIISSTIGLAVHPIDRSAFAFQARVTSSETSIATGVLVNYQDQMNFTAFLISNDGYFSVKEMKAGQWIDLAQWQTWPHVKRDQANILRVNCDNNNCTFFINDEVTWQLHSFSPQGSIGLTAYAPAAIDRSALITFDQIRFQDLSSAP